MLSRRSTEINHVLFANFGEDFLYNGEQAMFISIVMWLYPFTFQRRGFLRPRLQMRKTQYFRND